MMMAIQPYFGIGRQTKPAKMQFSGIQSASIVSRGPNLITVATLLVLAKHGYDRFKRKRTPHKTTVA